MNSGGSEHTKDVSRVKVIYTETNTLVECRVRNIDDMYEIISKELLSEHYNKVDDYYITKSGNIVIICDNKHTIVEPAVLAMLCKEKITNSNNNYLVSYSMNNIGYAKLILPNIDKESVDHIVIYNKIHDNINAEILAVFLLATKYYKSELLLLI